MHWRYIPMENIVRKREIAFNKQFLLFSQCFPPYMVHIFFSKCTCTLKCRLQFVSIWTSLKFCHLVMGQGIKCYSLRWLSSFLRRSEYLLRVFSNNFAYKNNDLVQKRSSLKERVQLLKVTHIFHILVKIFFLTFYSSDPHFDISTLDSFSKNFGKRRNCNKQFLLNQINVSPFVHIFDLLLNLKNPKLAYMKVPIAAN